MTRTELEVGSTTASTSGRAVADRERLDDVADDMVEKDAMASDGASSAGASFTAV